MTKSDIDRWIKSRILPGGLRERRHAEIRHIPPLKLGGTLARRSCSRFHRKRYRLQRAVAHRGGEVPSLPYFGRAFFLI
jgi:hypothetical protein